MGNQKDKVDVLKIVDPGVPEENNKVYLVREPAESKDDNNSDQHEDCSLLVPEDDQVLGLHTCSWGDRLPQAERYTDVGEAHHKEGDDVLKEDKEYVVEIEDLHLYLTALHKTKRYLISIIQNKIIRVENSLRSSTD